MSDQLVVLLVFIGVFAGIISEKIDKVLIVLAAALLLIASGYIGFEQAVHSIDFNTICLLLGMMLIVEALREVQIFDWLALKLGLLTRGSPILVFLLFGVSTAFASAFLDNVTTVLIVVPLVISICQSIGLNPKVYVLLLIFLANIGGTATLIGDPPNILIGSLVPELTFGAFIQYLGPVVAVTTVLTCFLLKFQHRKEISSRTGNFPWLFVSNLMLEQIKRQSLELKIKPVTMWKAGVLFALVLAGFFSHPVTHLEPAVVALIGAIAMLIAFQKELNLHHLIVHVEWPTLLFFSGLFVVVGTMEHVGLLQEISHLLVSVTDNLWVMLMIVIWASAVLSAVVDNIPFVAVMIPIIKDMIAEGPFAGNPKAHLLWWALALGACFGGNGSMIGASANVVSCALAEARGIKIGFKEFAKEAVPVTLMSIVVASLYITMLYFW